MAATPAGEHPLERPTVIAPDVDLPETLGYRLKRVLLGPPLTTEQLPNERLANPVALGVLSPDCISSSAYGSEEMLRILLPFFGAAAFTLLLPVTFVILGVLLLVTLSYREVVMVYTRAGGSYVVARENFGPGVAQIAAVALLIDYTVTVAVQTAAGTDALASAVPALSSPHVVLAITLASVVLLLYGNLRGIREAGRVFALPTYAFIVLTLLVIVVGLLRAIVGHLPVESLHHAGLISIRAKESALLLPISVFYLLKAFANGGSSLTGLEAISNGVGAFKPPEGRNARKVLVVMSLTLGTLVLGVSILARLIHAAPYATGTPTVISQEAKVVFGHSGLGHVLYFVVQLATMLVLYTGANTSFNGFPFLASFVAEDSFLPRQLTHRGHRLTFSNGIILLASVSFLLLLATGAQVDALVAVYAIGVFTGFTMAGAGMVRYHMREHRPGWQRRSLINGSAAAASFAVVIIFAVTKFTQGAWVVIVLFPVLVSVFLRLNRRYRAEARALGVVTARFGRMPNFERTVCVVMVDSLDLATIRALRYARSLRATELRAVHFMLDEVRSRALQGQWSELPDNEIPLDVIDCPDRRLVRDAVRLCAGLVEEDGGSQVTVLLPRRVYSALWGRLLHDRTADRIAAAVSRVRYVAATIVPFDPSGALERHGQAPVHGNIVAEETPGTLGAARDDTHPTAAVAVAAPPRPPGAPERGRRDRAFGPPQAPGCTPIGQVSWRQRARVQGQIRQVETRPMSGAPVLEVTIIDATGGLRLLFYGRRAVPGIVPGARLVAEGMVSSYKDHLAIHNPSYELLAPDSE
jgi:amino acid transporter